MWHNPLPLKLVPTEDSESFSTFPEGTTGLPIGRHPGAFGVRRKHHTHEGIDLYCPEGTPVRAVEDGIVVAVIKFTGSETYPPSPWWEDTEAVLVEGESGVVVYGEITATREVGDLVQGGSLLGYVVRVLKEDKGRPTSMLHLELHEPGTRDAYEWLESRPDSLLDPTAYFLTALSWVQGSSSSESP